MTGPLRTPHVGKSGRYECPAHGDTLTQAEPAKDLMVAYACPVLNCDYWSRFSLVSVLTGDLLARVRPGAPPPRVLPRVCICVGGRSRFCKAHDE